MLAAARGLGVTLIAYSPLAQGILTGRYHDDPALARALPWPPLASRRRGPLLTPEGLARTAPLIAELRAVGEAHGASAAQVALAWLVTHYGDTVVAIPGASRPNRRRPRGGHGPAADCRGMARLDELSAQVAKR